MDDLLQFLRDQLDQDERTARAATPGPWAVEGASVYVGHPTNEIVDYSESAEHIARHDPARVLAEVDAKRRVLDRYENQAALAASHVGGILTKHLVEELRAVVQLLALPYASRPGYPEKWRPTAS